MLAAMRKSVGSIFVKVFLFGILIVSFALWGITDWVSPNPADQTAATVGGHEVSFRDFDRAYRNELQRLNLASIDSEQARDIGLADRVMEGVVDRMLANVEADKLGLTAADETVRNQIRRDPSFQGQVGGFDPNLYRRILSLSGMTPEMFEARVRQDVARRQLLEAMVAGIQPPGAAIHRLNAYRNETREAVYLAVPFDGFADVGTPSDIQLQSFYDSNQEQYRRPEYRAVTYVHFDADWMAAEMEIPEARLREAYEDRRAEFGTAERRAITQFLAPDEETARRAAGRLSDGESLEAVAADLTGASPDSMDLGALARDEIPDPALADAAFSLERGQTSPPLQGAFGWFIVRVDGIEPGGAQSFDDVRDRLRRDLALDQAIEGVYRLSNDLDDMLGGGATLEEAARTVNVPIMRIAALDRQGRDDIGDPVDLPDPRRFLEVAFDLESGMPSLMHETDDNGYFVLRVDRVTPSQIPPFDAVRDRVAEDWARDQRARKAREQAEALKSRLELGDDFRAVAEDAGLSIARTGAFNRSGAGGGVELPPILVADLFDASVGGVAMARARDAYLIAKLEAINEAPPADRDRLAAEGLREGLSAAIASDILVQYREALAARHGVKVNDSVVQQVYRDFAM